MPNENIYRAIKRADEKNIAQLEELQIEAIGPEGVAFIIEAITDNRNRTIGEIKNILKECGIKMAQPGSLSWMFEKKGQDFLPKILAQINSPVLKEKINTLMDKLNYHEDIKKVYSNL